MRPISRYVDTRGLRLGFLSFVARLLLRTSETYRFSFRISTQHMPSWSFASSCDLGFSHRQKSPLWSLCKAILLFLNRLPAKRTGSSSAVVLRIKRVFETSGYPCIWKILKNHAAGCATMIVYLVDPIGPAVFLPRVFEFREHQRVHKWQQQRSGYPCISKSSAHESIATKEYIITSRRITSHHVASWYPPFAVSSLLSASSLPKEPDRTERHSKSTSLQDLWAVLNVVWGRKEVYGMWWLRRENAWGKEYWKRSQHLATFEVFLLVIWQLQCCDALCENANSKIDIGY